MGNFPTNFGQTNKYTQITVDYKINLVKFTDHNL